MTHPLSEELRTYAQRQIDYHCDEERTAKYLRRAADALDKAESVRDFENNVMLRRVDELQVQAARYREALEHIEGICPRDWLPWITKALCEPETGGET